MALPVALALYGLEDVIFDPQQAELHRKNLLRVLKVEMVVDDIPQQSDNQTPSPQRELNRRRRPNQRRNNENSQYWSLLNQVDNISLQEPNPITLDQFEPIRPIRPAPVGYNSPVQPEQVSNWADWTPLHIWDVNSTSTYMPMAPSRNQTEYTPIAGPSRNSPPSSEEIRSTMELMDYEYIYLPPTSTPWSTTLPALIDRTNENSRNRMQHPSISTLPLTSSTNSSPPTRNTRRSRSTSDSPPSPTRSRSPNRTPNRPRRSISTPTNISLTNAPPSESKERKSRRNSRGEPVIMYQNRDLLDLRSNLQPPAFRVNADLCIQQFRSENDNREPTVEEVVTCTEEDCNFLYIYCDINE